MLEYFHYQCILGFSFLASKVIYIQVILKLTNKRVPTDKICNSFLQRNGHEYTVQRTKAKENEISRNCQLTIDELSKRHAHSQREKIIYCLFIIYCSPTRVLSLNLFYNNDTLKSAGVFATFSFGITSHPGLFAVSLILIITKSGKLDFQD